MEKKTNYKMMIAKTKISIAAVESNLDKEYKQSEELLQQAREKKKKEDKRAAVQLMFSRKICLKKIEKYEKVKQQLYTAKEKLQEEQKALGIDEKEPDMDPIELSTEDSEKYLKELEELQEKQYKKIILQFIESTKQAQNNSK